MYVYQLTAVAVGYSPVWIHTEIFQKKMATENGGKEFGEEIRKDFMMREKSVFLNHGAFGGVPRCVHERQIKYLEEMESHPDIWFRYSIYKYLQKATEKVAQFMGIKAEDTYLIQNVTKAANTVLKTFPLEPGQAFLVNSLTYYALQRATKVAINRIEGAHIYHMDIQFPITSENSIVQQYDEYLTKHPDIKFTILDHISSPTAVVMPVKRLVEVCHRHDVIVMVDGAHVPGQLSPDIQDMDADFYTGNLHKWLYTPRSCAFVWTNPHRKFAWFKPLVTSAWDEQNLFKEFSYEGTNDVSPFLCAIDGIDYFNSLGGLERIIGYTTSLLEKGVAYLEERWGTKRLDVPRDMVAPNLRLVYLPDLPFYSEHPKKYLRLQKLLLEQFDVQVAVIEIQSRLMVRVSVQVYNTFRDFQDLAGAFLKLKERQDLEELDSAIVL